MCTFPDNSLVVRDSSASIIRSSTAVYRSLIVSTNDFTIQLIVPTRQTNGSYLIFQLKQNGLHFLNVFLQKCPDLTCITV